MKTSRIRLFPGGLRIALEAHYMTQPRLWVSLFLCCLLVQLAVPRLVFAQSAPAAVKSDDAAPQPTEPDFVLINLPTTLRLPLYKSNFRLTHRFNGNLRDGTFGQQLSNLFGLDNGAAIGFEYRFAIARHVQLAAYRTNIDRETQFYAKFDPVAQGGAMPVSISGLVSVEGANNFRKNRVPAFGAVVSRKVKEVAALYATPIWVHDSAVGTDVMRDTVFLGLGGRVHVRPAMYLVAEVSPRLGGYATGKPEYSVAFEGRVGGHVFQMNFSNTIGTTFLQTARGGFPNSLFLGFNLARKFY
jgi:Membrane bound beta barrel domain (DUF5777)